jgi:hypothetical protein
MKTARLRPRRAGALRAGAFAAALFVPSAATAAGPESAVSESEGFVDRVVEKREENGDRAAEAMERRLQPTPHAEARTPEARDEPRAE